MLNVNVEPECPLVGRLMNIMDTTGKTLQW